MRILECVKPPFFTAETVALVTSASVIGLLLVLAVILGLALFRRLSAELDRMRMNRIKRRQASPLARLGGRGGIHEIPVRPFLWKMLKARLVNKR